MSSHLETERVDFFNSLLQAYFRAEQVLGSRQWHGRLAGKTIALRGAGAEPHERLLPALMPWADSPSEPPDLTIHLWDGAGRQDHLPLLVRPLLWAAARWKHEALDIRYELKGFNDDRICTVYRLGPANILSVMDRARAIALYWVDDASKLPYWELGSPLQTLFNCWAEGMGLQYLHAAAVGTSEGAILLTGAGGAGKSSTALACLRAGMGYLADDYCLASQDRVWCLYGTAKLVGEADLERFPEWSPWVINPKRDRDDKILLDVYRQRAAQVLREAPLKAVVVPRICPGLPSRLRPIKGSEALLALGPTTMFQLAGTGQSSLARMAAVLRRTPTYLLELGSEMDSVPALLRQLL